MLDSRSAGSSGCSPATCTCWGRIRRTGLRVRSGDGYRGRARAARAARAGMARAARCRPGWHKAIRDRTVDPRCSGARLCEAAGMPVLVTACLLSAVAWLCLLVAHGGYWRTGCRLPMGGGDAGTDARCWPSVVAVVPARDEAAMLPLTLPSLLGQGYPGELAVVLVDDESSDGTAGVAESLGSAGSVVL